jgi:N-acetylglutamate synthase-like GNAT family acetyltransferase
VTEIVAYEPALASGCADVLASVPEWFGRPATNAQYLADLAALPSWVALDAGVPIGAVTLTEPQPRSFEVHFIVVGRAWHGRGVGSELLRVVERAARVQDGRWLHVKTLGPSHPDPHYALTRGFYLKQEFAPLFESTALWDARTPALIMVKALDRATT